MLVTAARHWNSGKPNTKHIPVLLGQSCFYWAFFFKTVASHTVHFASEDLLFFYLLCQNCSRLVNRATRQTVAQGTDIASPPKSFACVSDTDDKSGFGKCENPSNVVAKDAG